jgi:glycosyltransferase involved in cell wall biosynthesis
VSRAVIQFTDSIFFGGAERSLLNLAGQLKRSDWRPVIVHHDEPGMRGFIEEANEAGIETHVAPRLRGMDRPFGIPALARSLRSMHADIFHAHLSWPLACTSGLLAARFAGIPVVVATVQLFGAIPRTPTMAVLRRLHRPLVDRYVAVSAEIGRKLTDELGVPPRKVRVIPNGIDVADVSRSSDDAALRASLGIGSSTSLVLTAARLEEQKGHRFLIEAAKQVPDAVFVFAGQGPARRELEALARRNGLAGRIRFLGWRVDVPALVSACDVFVLPSLYEGTPLALLEAMAAAKPVIATRIPGISEMVSHGQTGVLVEPADPVALASSIRSLLGDPAERLRLGLAAEQIVRTRFNAAAMTRDVVDLYKQLAGREDAQSA